MYFCILPGAVLSVYKLPRTPGRFLEAAFSATEDSSLEAWSTLCKARSYPVPETADVSASFTVARGWWPAGTSRAPSKQHQCCEDAVGRSLRTTFQKPHQPAWSCKNSTKNAYLFCTQFSIVNNDHIYFITIKYIGLM